MSVRSSRVSSQKVVGGSSSGYSSRRSGASVNFGGGSCGNQNWYNAQGGGPGFNVGGGQDMAYGGGGFGGVVGGGYGGNAGGGWGGAGGAFGGGAGGAFGGGAGGGFDQFGGGFYGGGGGGGGGDGAFGGREGLFSASEKETMRNLNDRLAAYLDKVRALEAANADLEAKIKEWYEKNRPGTTTLEKNDYSKYFETIKELQTQIQTVTVENATVILEIDNARLAADDFRIKWENELHLRQNVEADINGLRKVLDELTLTNSDLESQVESLTEELDYLKKNHEEEMKSQQTTTVGDVNVEMDAAPGKDLTQILNEMRADYEAIAERNRRAVEDDFKKRSENVKQEITTGVQTIQTSKTEVTDLKRELQQLEMELTSQYAMKKSLEEQLASTEGNYCMQLSQLQNQISILEEELASLKNEVECHKSEYELLLEIKTRLEQEIEKYKQLLEGGDSQISVGTGTGAGTGSRSQTGSSSTQGTRSGSSTSQTSTRVSSAPTQSPRSYTTQSPRTGKI
ncbi:keratin, type I cytoskeletal 47 kDa-like [Spea bombifrons]|uniref:keratin, type I cytoskeletal 47 kDa-like n=1 Tax=Spea bombifrons TaxID=233779 RepID=UPI00234BF6C3|nr:keratin, type I cytoskeletal 47 kDa-like [Spea bombifrons]